MGEPCCELCGNPTPKKQLTRYARLELCASCMGDDLSRAIAAFPGVVSDTTHVWKSSSHEAPMPIYTLRVVLTFGEKHYMSGELRRELGGALGSAWRGVRGMLRLGDPEVGNTSFDDTVKINAAEDSVLVEFLRRSQGAQDACMELLPLVEAIIWSRDLDLQVERRASSAEGLEKPQVMRAMLALAHHMTLDVGR